MIKKYNHKNNYNCRLLFFEKLVKKIVKELFLQSFLHQ